MARAILLAALVLTALLAGCSSSDGGDEGAPTTGASGPGTTAPASSPPAGSPTAPATSEYDTDITNQRYAGECACGDFTKKQTDTWRPPGTKATAKIELSDHRGGSVHVRVENGQGLVLYERTLDADHPRDETPTAEAAFGSVWQVIVDFKDLTGDFNFELLAK